MSNSAGLGVAVAVGVFGFVSIVFAVLNSDKAEGLDISEDAETFRVRVNAIRGARDRGLERLREALIQEEQASAAREIKSYGGSVKAPCDESRLALLQTPQGQQMVRELGLQNAVAEQLAQCARR